MKRVLKSIDKYLLQVCIWTIMLAGVAQLFTGSVAIGVIQILTALYITTIAIPRNTGYMVKRYAIWVSILTVVMVGNIIALLCMKEYFGAFATALVTLGGIGTLIVYYFANDKEEK